LRLEREGDSSLDDKEMGSRKTEREGERNKKRREKFKEDSD